MRSRCPLGERRGFAWICARYPASVIATTFRRRTRAASCDTAMPTMNNTANVVTSAEVRMVNRPYGTVKKRSKQIAAQIAARAPASPLPIAATATTTTTRNSATSVSAQVARRAPGWPLRPGEMQEQRRSPPDPWSGSRSSSGTLDSQGSPSVKPPPRRTPTDTPEACRFTPVDLVQPAQLPGIELRQAAGQLRSFRLQGPGIAATVRSACPYAATRLLQIRGSTCQLAIL